ncbi:hypothetical protein ACHAPV_009086 [Trichoderma viride]
MLLARTSATRSPTLRTPSHRWEEGDEWKLILTNLVGLGLTGLYMSNDAAEATYSCYNGNLYYLVSAAGDYHGCPSEDIALTVDTVDPPSPPCTDSLFTAPQGLDRQPRLEMGRHYCVRPHCGIRRHIRRQRQYQRGGLADYPRPRKPGHDDARLHDSPGVQPPSCLGLVDESLCLADGVRLPDHHQQNNIQGTNGEWTTGIGSQRHIASLGTCHFGVDNSGVTGDVTYYTGSQDIVNIITQSIALYGGGDQVGAKGYMECAGDAGSQYVEWGLY